MEKILHYYAFNIGDYTSHTAHLSPIEDIAYRRLLDLYYQTESAIPDDLTAICRQIRMRGHEEDVRVVLSEFFKLSKGLWFSERCEQEINGFKRKAEAARINGRKGGRPSEAKPKKTQQVISGLAKHNPEQTQGKTNQNPDETQHEPSEKLTNNHKPITNNQEPIKEYSAHDARDSAYASKKSRTPKLAEKPDDVDQQTWDDFLQLRKTKRAPLTVTALATLRAESNKALLGLSEALQTCCLRGWQGFKAEWLLRDANFQTNRGFQSINKQEALEARNRAVGDAWVAEMMAKAAAEGGEDEIY